jgi:hypothetical protein
MGKPASKVADVQVPGPLARYTAGFTSALLAAGYTPLSVVNLMRLMVHLSRWLGHAAAVGGRADRGAGRGVMGRWAPCPS